MPLIHTFEMDVHIFDTDCYGVVWHGAYAKWLEMGRVDLFKRVGLDLNVMSRDHDIVFPVVEQNLRFKSSARFGDRLAVSSHVSQSGLKMTFDQRVQDVNTGALVIEARTDIVLINGQGKLYRKIPDVVQEKLAQLV